MHLPSLAPHRAPCALSWLLVVLLGTAAVRGQVEPSEGAPGIAPLAGARLVPRRALDPGPVSVPPIPADAAEGVRWRLVVKLDDAVRGRATPDGGLRSLVDADLSALGELAATEGLAFRPLLGTPPERLAAVEARAAARSGRAQPDLAGLLRVVAPADVDPSTLALLGERLRGQPGVEFVHLQALGAPPPEDFPPTTSDLSPNQVYMAPDPGFDVASAWAEGWRGQGIRLADCEYGWNLGHEDLVDQPITPEPGQTIHPDVYVMGWDDHGTSVLGVTSAGMNGYGVNGIAPGASVGVYTEWSVEEGPRRETAVMNAVADSAFGDVVLLEMQAFGQGGGLAPAETDPAMFVIVKAGVDAGVVVVAAAGNGSQNLDAAAYFPYRQMGDSGAIIVGAGTASLAHDKLSFSTYGKRVDVQGWGQNVVTLGGNWLTVGGDPDQAYNNGFSGTSSAAALVAGLCCLVQEAAVATGGARLPPRDVRLLLSSTGAPQGLGGNIGPLPQMDGLLAKLPDYFLPRWDDLGGGTPGLLGVPRLTGSGDLTPGSPLSLTLEDGAPLGLALLWLSGDSQPTPFLGGTLHAWPFFSQILLLLDVNGSVTGTVSFPAGQPSGTQLWYQMGVVDVSVPVHGGALSNALMSTTP